MLRGKILAGPALAAALAFGATVGPVAAATAKYSVTEPKFRDGAPQSRSASDSLWYREDTRPGSSVSLVKSDPDFPPPVDADPGTPNGPGGPPGFDNGSLSLFTNNQTNAKAQLFTSHQVYGTALSDVTNLSYWTYQSRLTGTSNDNASYQLRVDLDGNLSNGGETNLVYETYFNDDDGPNPQGPIPQDTWKHWNADSGVWWSSKTIHCSGGTPDPYDVPAGAGGVDGDKATSPAEVANGCPNAKVVAVGVNAGTYNTNYIVAVDGVHFATAANDYTWDFLPITK